MKLTTGNNLFFHLTLLCALLLGCIGARLQAAPAIKSVTQSPDPVGKYVKLELTVGLAATFTNPYDPDQIDLSARFTSPTKKVWNVNGFYDGAQWKIRFAANETGTWSYTVTAQDASGVTSSPAGAFTCKDSSYHGWVRVAPNKRYLCYDDGTSFYGVGACHAWGVTTNTLDRMQALGFNTYVYWNGTYDMDGGNNLIESTASGIGKYDQGKCARLDELIDWSEARGLTMILVILPHDYACEDMGRWPAKWQQNPYKDIVSSTNYYSDAVSWAYQKKQYRYIIARWGYSRGLSAWQTVDEISGTSGWKVDRDTANEWAAKIGTFFQTNDPFKHPTTASHGSFWDAGNKANDLPNTEIYGNYSTTNIVTTVERLWNNYTKPCIMGETGASRNGDTTHRKLWGGLAAGIAVTPLLWQFNQGWNTNMSAQYPSFLNFISDINFAGLTNPAQAKVTVTGANAYGITSDQMAFGWITGDFSGKNLGLTGLANNSYRLQWFDCMAGNVISTNIVSVTNGTLIATIPATDQIDMAYKIVAGR
jgi:Domain of unknown function (DUF5060)